VSPRIGRLAVVGLGLLGGSVARAARARGVAGQVVATGRHPEALRAAVDRGVVDAVVPLEEVGRGADLVVLATPVGAMAALLGRIAGSLESGALVTDVGSVKGLLADTLPGLLPAGAAYVGAHPMAGSHRRGWEHSSPDLFAGAPCVVTPMPGVSGEAVAAVEAFWRALGAVIVRRSPTAHDREVAWTSHVPHALAFAFARALAAAPPEVREVAGSGFRDFTRIARSDAELWSDILMANRKALEPLLGEVGRRLRELGGLLEARDAAGLERVLGEAREALTRATESHEFDARSGGESPEIPVSATETSEGANAPHE